jgi:MFS family permease
VHESVGRGRGLAEALAEHAGWFAGMALAVVRVGEQSGRLAEALGELATILLVFETIREEERTSVLTTFNLLNALAMVGGSLIGGAILHAMGNSFSAYVTVFLVSTAARAATLPLIARISSPPFEPLPVATGKHAVHP